MEIDPAHPPRHWPHAARADPQRDPAWCQQNGGYRMSQVVGEKHDWQNDQDRYDNDERGVNQSMDPISARRPTTLQTFTGLSCGFPRKGA